MKKIDYYQPEWSLAITYWSYTLIIFLISLFLWLEITVFQIWTVLTFILFLFVLALQIFKRRIYIKKNAIIFTAVIPINTLKIDYSRIQKVSVSGNSLQIVTKHHKYKFLVLKKSALKIKEKINVRIL